MHPHEDRVPYDQPAPRGGRHRRGGGTTGRPARRLPSFRAAVTLAGTATAALTVTAGAYVASLGGQAAAGARLDPAAQIRTTVTPAAGASAPPSAAPGGAPAAVPVTPSAEASPSASEAGPAPTPEAAPSTAPGTGTVTDPSAPAPGTAPPAARATAATTAPASTAPASARVVPGSGKAAPYIDRVISLVNAERDRAGCGPLRHDRRLRSAAQAHADDMSARNYYGHENPEGRNAGDRITAAGYSWSVWAENIHRGPKTPAAAMREWMRSDGHRHNILNCAFKDIGIGLSLNADGPWWVQNFAVRR
ncbi:CAP domain-containing protein [Streptomyces sp. NPDC008121]|uniref:CAP domain-containing protein n=1 Tax=Streptomyces sp. NPDC008121 TaxID=3364809 RepID=UPI0036EB1207